MLPAPALRPEISKEYRVLWPGWRPAGWPLFRNVSDLRVGRHLLHDGCLALTLGMAPLAAALIALVRVTVVAQPVWDGLPLLPLLPLPTRFQGPAAFSAAWALGAWLGPGRSVRSRWRHCCRRSVRRWRSRPSCWCRRSGLGRSVAMGSCAARLAVARAGPRSQPPE